MTREKRKHLEKCEWGNFTRITPILFSIQCKFLSLPFTRKLRAPTQICFGFRKNSRNSQKTIHIRIILSKICMTFLKGKRTPAQAFLRKCYNIFFEASNFKKLCKHLFCMNFALIKSVISLPKGCTYVVQDLIWEWRSYWEVVLRSCLHWVHRGIFRIQNV